MDELHLLIRYREFLQTGKTDCIEPQDVVSYGKQRPLRWQEKNQLKNEINRLEKAHGLPLTA